MNNEIEQVSDRASSLALITSEGNMARVMSMAKMMAGSKVTVPKHLQGSEGDCAAIVIQATNWGMNPFAVAQKTHLVNGVLGYEAQLVNAVIQSSNAIKGTFSYECKDEGGTAPNAFVTCRVGAILNGQSEITWGEWLASASVTTKNSPLWKTNVKQQMGYLQVKNWARLYCPGAILGVYTAEELEDMPAAEKVVQGEIVLKEKIYLSDTDFDSNKTKWESSVKLGKKSVENLIIWIETKGTLLTKLQLATINTWTVTPVPQTVENEVKQGSDNSDFLSDYSEGEHVATA